MIVIEICANLSIESINNNSLRVIDTRERDTHTQDKVFVQFVHWPIALRIDRYNTPILAS